MSGWDVTLGPEDLACLDRALENAVTGGLTWSSLTPSEFPLPELSEKLQTIGSELEDGSGMVRIRGLTPDHYTAEEQKLLWYGLCLHLGVPVYQNAEGQLLRKICDEGEVVGTRYGQVATEDGVFLSSRARTASTAGLRFHTDRADIVGLFCLGRAKSGGQTRIASSVNVHNQMLRQRPELVELLYAPIYRSRLGEEAGGERMFYSLPVFGCRDGKFTSHYSRTYVEAAQLLPEVPRMTDVQWAALDLLAELAEQFCFETVFEPGDMQFLNNHVIYHARHPFNDDAAAGFQRRLMRIWLCPPGNRALPEDHTVLWGSVAAGERRGGIALDKTL